MAEYEVGEIRKTGPFWELWSAEGCLAITQARLRWVRKALDALRAR